MSEFDCPNPITLALRAGAGVVDITAEERTTAVVDIRPYDDSDAAHEAADNTHAEMHGDTLVIAVPDRFGLWPFRRRARLRISVRVPLDSVLAVKSASSDVTARGRYASAGLGIASGDAYIEHVTGDADLKTASGDVGVDRLDGPVQVKTASGDVTLGHTSSDVNVHAASGDVRIGHTDAFVRVVSASGDIDVAHTARGTLNLRTASGDVTVGIATGTSVWLDLNTTSGDARNDLPMTQAPDDRAGADVTLNARTMSGNIRVRRSAEQPSGSTQT
jgi:hypothetical protein